MKTLQRYIREDFKISHKTGTKIHVKNFDELRYIVIERYNKNEKHVDLRDIDVSAIHTFVRYNNGYDKKCLFSELKNVETIDITGWNTSNATDMAYMFYDSCANEIIGIESLDTEKCRTMRNTFSGNKHLTELDLSNWTIDNVTDIAGMFAYCDNLEKVKGIDDWDDIISSKGINAEAMTYKSSNLVFPTWHKKYDYML